MYAYVCMHISHTHTHIQASLGRDSLSLSLNSAGEVTEEQKEGRVSPKSILASSRSVSYAIRPTEAAVQQGAQFTCFTGTTVKILTHKALQPSLLLLLL